MSDEARDRWAQIAERMATTRDAQDRRFRMACAVAGGILANPHTADDVDGSLPVGVVAITDAILAALEGEASDGQD